MANFCKRCGRPLENGSCPVCDNVESVYTQAASSGGFFGSLRSDLQGLFSSANPFRIAPVIGFALVALTYLLRSFFSFSSNSIPYGVYITLYWVDILALIGVGLGAVNLFQSKKNATASLYLLLGFTGVLNLMSMLANDFGTYNYIMPCLFLLVLNLVWSVQEHTFRALCVGGAGALALVLLIQAFTTLPFLPQLAICYCALLSAMALLKAQPQL